MWAVILWIVILDTPVPAIVHVQDRLECAAVKTALRADASLVTYRDSLPVCVNLRFLVAHTTPFRFDTEPVRVSVWINPLMGE